MRTRRTSSSGAGAVQRAARGFTLIELMVVMSILMVALLTLSSSLGTSMTLTEVNRDSALATDGAQEALERLQGVEEFLDILPLHDADPANDPVGVIGPGPGFDVPGLEPTADDPDGRVGEIVFPLTGGQLIENVVNEEFGLPRDLNGDGMIDNVDHLGDYTILPVQVRLRWNADGRTREIEVRTLLADRWTTQ